MEYKNFLVDKIELDFGGLGQSEVSLLGPRADQGNTHISIIVGANGTSKSRILACLVEKLCEIQSLQNEDNELRRNSIDDGGLFCKTISTIQERERYHYSDFKNGESENFSNLALPSRILVLSNLVKDKFHYPQESNTDQNFYHYLGVRQSTNLMTTGSLERAVTEAVLRMSSDFERLDSFQRWVNVVFDGGRELALVFPRSWRSDFVKLFEAADKETYILERLQRRYGLGRKDSYKPESVRKTTIQIVELFDFLSSRLNELQISEYQKRNRPELFLRLASLSNADRLRLTELIPNFTAASRAGYSMWPKLAIEASPWLSFDQLSSGEQNILSVGAKIIAYARPGCLIVIDEPEVSLNVAWQQHYTDLIQKSLSHAPGSHVLIATHSPHLISSLPAGKGSIVLIEKGSQQLTLKTVDARFEGWGAEAVLYQVLGIPSASSFHFNRELARVLRHIQEGGKDKVMLSDFITTASKLNLANIEPLSLIVAEIQAYSETLN